MIFCSKIIEMDTPLMDATVVAGATPVGKWWTFRSSPPAMSTPKTLQDEEDPQPPQSETDAAIMRHMGIGLQWGAECVLLHCVCCPPLPSTRALARSCVCSRSSAVVPPAGPRIPVVGLDSSRSILRIRASSGVHWRKAEWLHRPVGLQEGVPAAVDVRASCAAIPRLRVRVPASPPGATVFL
jgi:hypothetical protein